MSLLALLALALKLLAYAAWCGPGLRLLGAGPARAPLARAFGLATLRLGLGLALGWGLVVALLTLDPEPGRLGVSLPSLGIGFVLLRWLEWSFVGALALGRAREPRAILLGRSGREHLWRLGGLALSFATDVAAWLAGASLGGIPC